MLLCQQDNLLFLAYASSNNNPLADYAQASYDLDQVPRGAFPVSYTVVHSVGGVPVDASLLSTGVTDTWTIVVSTVVSEPIVLSPFIFGDPEYNCQGFLGINNMTFTFNIDATCKRLFSSANPYITNVALGSLANPNGFNYQQGAVGGNIFQTPPASPPDAF